MPESRNPFHLLKGVLCLICYVLGLTIYISGFIPATVNKLHSFTYSSLYLTCVDITNNQEVCQNMEFNLSYTKHYDKFVLVIIDALRADFVPSILPNPEFDTSLPFTEELIRTKKALSFINQVHSPTVTMPRIKTLVTGGISNFIDVITNLNAAELKEDNFLAQALVKNMKSIFYGDDTWLKLFPDYFKRSDGTHSFFVSDFKEVDDNVTRHLPKELSSDDWDIMILHYLGVDHIGHSYGPRSHHMSVKLKEMDEVIKVIYNRLTTKPIKSLIAVSGDHGMTAGGSHGGITKSELLTPLIFINSNSSEYSVDPIETISQVDFAVTISILLGTPIPANSFGCIIPSALNFSGLSRRQILNAAFYNLLQLFNIHKIIHPHTEAMYSNLIENTISKHSKVLNSTSMENVMLFDDYHDLLKLYMSLLNELKQNLLSSMAGYNESSIIIGLVLMWLSFICSVICFFKNQCSLRSSLIFCLPATVFNKFNIFIILTLVLVYVLIPIDLYTLLLIPTGMLVLNLLPMFIRFLAENVKLSFMEKICVSMFFLHVVSLFSSSFIEEEHLVWYFSVNTILILYLTKCLLSVISYCLKNKTSIHQIQMTHLWDLVCLDKNSSDACQLLILLVSHRVLRSWNQTGNKWQHLPDISDWVNKEENVWQKLFLIIASQITVLFNLKAKQRPLTFQAMCFGSVCIFIYKCKSDYISLLFKDYNVDLIVFSWLGYAIIVFITASAIKLITSRITIPKKMIFIDLISASVLLAELIGRSHNIPIIAAILIQEHLLNNVLPQGYDKSLLKVSIYLQLAMCSFFYQGNSNSLSTIDVFSGYTGLLSYQPFIAGILITFNTYSAIILWLLLLIYRMFSFNHSTAVGSLIQYDIFSSFSAIVIYRLFILAVYCIIMNLMKHHLFVLSVFAPKLFYETCHVIFFVLFISFIVMISNILSVVNI